MLPSGRWGSQNFRNSPNENDSGSYDPVTIQHSQGRGITTPASAPWSPSSLSPYPRMGELHGEAVGAKFPMIDSAMQSPISDPSHATARHVLEAGKVASVAGDVPSSSVFELAASEPKNSTIAHSQHLSVPVSELSASPHHSTYTTTHPHASMPISELSEGSEAATPGMRTPVGHGVDGLAVGADCGVGM
ncbi:MAG: hypothetical protein LQ347_003160, partial [Umbilicaria vellea]